MGFATAGDVFELLAEAAAGEVGAACAGGVDVGDGEARIVGHGDQRGLAEAGVAFDGDVVGVDGGVGLEVVDQAEAPQAQARRAPQSSGLRSWP